MKKIFTDGSLKGEKAAAAAVSITNFNHPIQLRLPNRSSIYTAELRAILLALKHVYQSNNTHSLIISDSLSALQSISSRKITHPILVEIHNLLSELALLWKTVVFMWVPSHVGIHGNALVDKAAKDALNHDIPPLPRQFVFHLDLRRQTKLYCKQLWQDDWSNQPRNKLFQVLPNLSDRLPTVTKNRKEETILSRLHIGHTYVTHSFLLKNEDPPWCFCCDAPFTVEHFLTECSDLVLPRNQCFNSNSLTVIFKEVSLNNLFCFLKSVNLFDNI